MPEMNIIQAVNDALRVEMRRDARVVVLGEDVGRFGGVFRATDRAVTRSSARDRCIDTPLAESGIVGTAIGMALYGLRPVPEIQFADFIYPAFDQIVNELAKLRYRSGGEYPAPVVIRTPVGGGIKGGHYHSQSPEALFIHTPGLKVVMPVEPGRRQGPAASAHPRRRSGDLHGAEARLPCRQGRGARRATTPSRSARPRSCARGGRSRCSRGARWCTPRSRRPRRARRDGYRPGGHRPAHAAAVRHRRDPGVGEEDRPRGHRPRGAARPAASAPSWPRRSRSSAILHLEAPILRVTGFDTPFPYTLEHEYLPDADRVLDAVERVVNF